MNRHAHQAVRSGDSEVHRKSSPTRGVNVASLERNGANVVAIGVSHLGETPMTPSPAPVSNDSVAA